MKAAYGLGRAIWSRSPRHWLRPPAAPSALPGKTTPLVAGSQETKLRPAFPKVLGEVSLHKLSPRSGGLKRELWRLAAPGSRGGENFVRVCGLMSRGGAEGPLLALQLLVTPSSGVAASAFVLSEENTWGLTTTSRVS